MNDHVMPTTRYSPRNFKIPRKLNDLKNALIFASPNQKTSNIEIIKVIVAPNPLLLCPSSPSSTKIVVMIHQAATITQNQNDQRVIIIFPPC
jgi:hypothetical protein